MKKLMVVTLAVAGLVTGVLVPSAMAGPGSLIGGAVWADTNRDGVRQAGETARAGVTVELLRSPAGTVAASTTTSATGAYSFADVADGAYVVRVDAPGAFHFPGVASGENDFVRAGQPDEGEPERGVTAPFTVTGAAQIAGLNAGMQPIADLRVEQLELDDACEGFAQTGTPPFDATAGPGSDTGTANCIIRTGDTVRQQYGVSLTGLPTGASVPNVVVELTVSSPDGAALSLAGPGPNGIPAGCLTAANGASPPSGRTLNPDGSITVTCNVGTMASNVAALELTYRVGTASAVPSHASVAVRSYAGQGDAGTSAPVSGPVVEVTGSAEWELDKTSWQAPRATSRVIDGVVTQGFQLWYVFGLDQPGGVTGNGQLDWPIPFTDRLTEFPNARIVDCPRVSPGRGFPSSWGENWWGLTCPLNEVAGADGWNLALAPLAGFEEAALSDSRGLVAMDVFVPEEDVYRVLDPGWQPGDDRPVGDVAWENHAIDTDGWVMNGGQPNNGDGFEPGWDGTTASGDNVTTHSLAVTEPAWDLAKARAAGPTFATRTIDGQEVVGYEIWYNLAVSETNGALFADFVDDVAFRDRLVTHPDAELISCRAMPSGGGANTGTPTCETGVQPADGWDMSFEPNQRGLDLRTGQFQAQFFIPADAIAVDPCQATPTDSFRVRNEAVDSDGWTAGGDPVNGTGFEPGWDGTTATGNNVVDQTYLIRSTVSDCGTFAGNKAWTFGPTLTWPGRVMGTQVDMSASNDRVSITDVTACDVFDVSVLFIQPNTYGPGRHSTLVTSGTIDAANYVIEYAEGPNETRTQAPTDFTSIQDAAAGCREHAGPWETDPTAFGADWQDTVNMIRVRPIDVGRVETGPFGVSLRAQLVTRGVYNGGPNAGEVIPSGVVVTNVGGWTTRDTGTRWATAPRQVPFQGMVLAIAKSVPQAQYLPGDSFRWSVVVRIGQAFDGAVMENVRVVDTLPDGLIYDAACTEGLLPEGVTATYDPIANTVTFLFGDVVIDAAPNHWIAGGGGKPPLQVCSTVPSLAQPGDFHRNDVQALADNSANAPTAAAQVQIAGSGQLGIIKSVDTPFVASGEEYTWSLEWGNTSTVIAFQAPDVIDVLPWNGDGDPASGSTRDQYPSDYTGLAQLAGPLAAPTYLRGGSGGDVPGTWYYATADPSTLDHDPRHPANAGPAAAGGLWLTAAEVADFDDVTAVRFVSAEALPVQSRVEARITAVSTSDDLDNVYVNRAMITSATVPDQPLLSNEPYVLMPGFTLGDLVWIDRNGNGIFDGDEQGVPGVTVQVRDEDGDVVATRVTDADGRWSVAAIPAGTYTAHIPASMFAAGGPLEDHVVRTVGSSDANDPNEDAGNNNTPTPDPAATGLTSTSVTLAYVYEDEQLVGGNGPSGDDVADLAGDLIPDAFSTFTVDLALMPSPGIDIEKATNGQDADDPTGPYVLVGGEVTWTYVVTNTGGVDLSDVTVTDDLVEAAAIDCDGTGSNVVAGPLAPGATFTCVATGTAIAGQYANTGTVTGLDPTLVQVDDEDPSHYFGAAPDVDIEKATNTLDADEAPGPFVPVGGPVTWTYVVTNTGNVPLADVTVTDDMVDAAVIDCGDGSNVVAGPVAPGGSFTCTATGAAVAGQYANLGTVVGTPPVGPDVTDDDPSHHFGATPAIDIEKATNGADADDAPGVHLRPGDPVTWTYVVTNTGNVPLTNVVVTDDRVEAGEIDCGSGSNVVAGPVAPGGSFTCTATGTAIAGQYANTGTVTGVPPDGLDPVEDDDPSHYFGATPGVDIEKATNGEDADEAPGVYVPVGGPVTWTYVVTNTGNVPLTNVVVTDDRVDAGEIDCGDGSNVVAGPVAPGGSFTCSAAGTAVEGQYANVGAVVGTPPGGLDPVEDDDPSHYFGATPGVDIEKATNGEDADDPTGPGILAGDMVTWTYVVTNTGNVPLTNVVVTDDQVDAGEIRCGELGSNVVPGPLAVGGSFECVATSAAVEGQYANLGSVTADPPGGLGQVDDDDRSHYFGESPGVDIEKATNGEDADDPIGPFVAVGDPVTWTYVVTNTGNVPLADVTVTDDMVDAAAIDCGTGSNVVAGPVAPGASFTCTATGTAVEGQYRNLGTVSGTPPHGPAVTDGDPSHHFGSSPAVEIEKATNGEDADDAPGPSVEVGDEVTWTYVVTNTGNVTLTDVTVTDDVLDESDIDCGSGTNVVAELLPGGSVTCTATGVAIEGQYRNLGTVSGTPPVGDAVTDDDPSHYVGGSEVGSGGSDRQPPTAAGGGANPPPRPGTGALPRTGTSVATLLLIAGAALATGIALRSRSKRGHAAHRWPSSSRGPDGGARAPLAGRWPTGTGGHG